MGNRTLVRGAALFFALVVLILSVVETASVKYAFGAKEPDPTQEPKEVDVTYELPYPGSVIPGSPLWPLKALRDKVSLEFTNGLAEVDFKMHLADKRLASGWEIWEAGDANEALLTFEKSEGYFLSAFDDLKKMDSNTEGIHDSVRQLTYASLKHREVLEKVLAECNDEARPMVTKLLDTPKYLYTAGSSLMSELGMTPPDNPF